MTDQPFLEVTANLYVAGELPYSELPYKVVISCRCVSDQDRPLVESALIKLATRLNDEANHLQRVSLERIGDGKVMVE